MKKMYWRPQRMSSLVLLLLATVSAGSLAVVETSLVDRRQPVYRAKMAAARLTLRCFQAIKQEHLRRGIPINKEFDPRETGLIGELITPVTTNTGHIAAKQLSINPNFSAVVVELLRQAKVGAGDLVAVGMSGSFPALNIATLAALKTLRIRALAISSVGSSQWGANHPLFMWPDMERTLTDRNLLPSRSITLSLGGINDQALGLSPQGQRLLRDAIARSDLRALKVKDYQDSLRQRMALYRELSGDAEIKAYINVGGGTISVGTHVGKHLFRPGLNRGLPRGTELESVMTRFASRHIPVVHLSNIATIAETHGLNIDPLKEPQIGEGTVFIRKTYNRMFAACALLLSLLALIAFLRLDLGHRLFVGKGDPSSNASTPEPMI